MQEKENNPFTKDEEEIYMIVPNDVNYNLYEDKN